MITDYAQWIMLASGLSLVSLSFMVETPNAKSTLLYKVFPFLVGSSSLVCASKMIGII